MVKWATYITYCGTSDRTMQRSQTELGIIVLLKQVSHKEKLVQ
jgi:hypothetical protein